jgi:oligopeptide transport system ATP-binding protein
MRPLLELRDLHISIRVPNGEVRAVRGVDLSVDAGETLALVGESGCGKSITAMSIAGLLPTNAAIASGDIFFGGVRLNDCTEKTWNSVRGSQIGFVFQNPMSSFNPSMRIGDQIAEVLQAHRALSGIEARKRSVQLLDRMHIANAAARARQYPFEMSGGMLQRAMIAMAVACQPKLLIADEPTTALDVTVQKEVLQLLAELQRDSEMACLLITHDLGIVAQMADRVAVMYAGEIIEQGPLDAIFRTVAHPYTHALHAALPEAGRAELLAIPGTPPDLAQRWSGCSFYPRCPHAMKICVEEYPPAFIVGDNHFAHCWLRHPQCLQRVSINGVGSGDE